MEINDILSELNELKDLVKSYINVIENEFQKQNFNTNKIINNSGIEIIFYGLKIIIIPETIIYKESVIRYEVQLNSYIYDNNEKKLLLFWTFNINNTKSESNINDFAKNYFSNLIKSILQYILDNETTLQL